MNKLKKVIDPEVGINVVDMGFIYDVKVSGDVVEIKMSLTSPFCPMAGLIDSEIKENVKKLKGIKKVDVELVWEPPWSPERMTEEARIELGI